MAVPITSTPRQSNSIGGASPARFDLRLLTDDEERAEAISLRGRAYVAMGHLRAEDGNSFTDRFDDLATTALIGAFDADRLVGTLRVSFSHPWQNLSSLPCAAHYPALAAVKRAAAGSLIEISRMAIEPDIDNRSYRTTLYATLVRAGYLAAQASRASTILVATKPDWVKFYQYMLGFEMIGKPAKYPPGDFEIALLGGSLAQAERRQRKQNAFFRITLEEIASMRAALKSQLYRPAVVPASGVASR